MAFPGFNSAGSTTTPPVLWRKTSHPLGVVVRKENFLGMVRGWKPGAGFLEPGTLIPTHDGYFYMSTFWATGAQIFGQTFFWVFL